jgi:hypothetical protein
MTDDEFSIVLAELRKVIEYAKHNNGAIPYDVFKPITKDNYPSIRQRREKAAWGLEEANRKFPKT